LNVAIFVLLLVMPLALGAGYLLARRLTRRLERLTAATGALAAGQLDQRVEIDSQDELGRLSSDFNQMAARLAERERALADAAAQAEALLRANKRLVADVSHELRNPLATLRGYLEALEQSHGDKLPSGDMHVIRNETQRLTTLVEDLFTVARAEAQQLPLTITSVDVGALARSLAATLAPLARRERQIELVTEIPADLPLAQADQTRLEQVLRNLAQNALRYTQPGGIVVLAAQADAQSVTLQVADTGVGIAPDELGLVFERFYRGDSSRARETGGAGLGLALVKELVEAMGGSVAVESEVGRGSVFRVVLRRG
jgi:signal transduction histidine kinase